MIGWRLPWLQQKAVTPSGRTSGWRAVQNPVIMYTSHFKPMAARTLRRTGQSEGGEDWRNKGIGWLSLKRDKNCLYKKNKFCICISCLSWIFSKDICASCGLEQRASELASSSEGIRRDPMISRLGLLSGPCRGFVLRWRSIGTSGPALGRGATTPMSTRPAFTTCFKYAVFSTTFYQYSVKKHQQQQETQG